MNYGGRQIISKSGMVRGGGRGFCQGFWVPVFFPPIAPGGGGAEGLLKKNANLNWTRL